MKTLRKAAYAVIGLFCIAACGNAGARNEKKVQDEQTSTEKAVIELTSETFRTKVYDLGKEELSYLGDKPAIVDFNATWCGPCKRIAPILEELANEYKDRIVIYKVDVDKCPDLAQAFGISSIPALLFIPLEGEPVMTVGSRDKAKFKEEIETTLLGK